MASSPPGVIRRQPNNANATARQTVSLHPRVFRALRRLAWKEGESMSRLANRVITEYLQTHADAPPPAATPDAEPTA